MYYIEAQGTVVVRDYAKPSGNFLSSSGVLDVTLTLPSRIEQS